MLICISVLSERFEVYIRAICECRYPGLIGGGDGEDAWSWDPRAGLSALGGSGAGVAFVVRVACDLLGATLAAPPGALVARGRVEPRDVAAVEPRVKHLAVPAAGASHAAAAPRPW